MTNKRIISGLAALVMTFSGAALPMYAFAENAETAETEQESQYKQSGDYIYEVNDDGSVTIARYTGSEQDLVIPETIDGMTVTALGGYSGNMEPSGAGGWTGVRKGAFDDIKNTLRSVVIPDTVTDIESFGSCENLESVTFGKGLKTVRFYAFLQCPKLKSVTLPDSLESIGEEAFGYLLSGPEGSKVDGFTIHCAPNTAAEKYAIDNGFAVVYTKAADVQLTSFTSTANAVRINWNGSAGMTGYRVYRLDEESGEWIKVKTIKDSSVCTYRQSGLEAGSSYKYKVQSYVKVDGANLWGELSEEFTAATKPEKVSVTKVGKSDTALRLYWDKVACDGYKVQQYDAANKSWKTVKLISSDNTSVRFSGLKSNTAYRFRIRAFKRVGSDKLFGAWSDVSTAATKRSAK